MKTNIQPIEKAFLIALAIALVVAGAGGFAIGKQIAKHNAAKVRPVPHQTVAMAVQPDNCSVLYQGSFRFYKHCSASAMYRG